MNRLKSIALAALSMLPLPASAQDQLSDAQLGIPDPRARWHALANLEGKTYFDGGLNYALKTYLSTDEAVIRVEGRFGTQIFVVTRDPATRRFSMSYARQARAGQEAIPVTGEVSITENEVVLTAGRERWTCVPDRGNFMPCTIGVRESAEAWTAIERIYFDGKGDLARVTTRAREGVFPPVWGDKDTDTVAGFHPANPREAFHGTRFDPTIAIAGSADGTRLTLATFDDQGNGGHFDFRRVAPGRYEAQGFLGKGERSERGVVATMTVGRPGEIIVTTAKGTTGYRLSSGGDQLLVRTLAKDSSVAWRDEEEHIYRFASSVAADLPAERISAWGALAAMVGSIWAGPAGDEWLTFDSTSHGRLTIFGVNAPGTEPVVCVARTDEPLAGAADFDCLGPQGKRWTMKMTGIGPAGFTRDGIAYARRDVGGEMQFVSADKRDKMVMDDWIGVSREFAAIREKRRIDLHRRVEADIAADRKQRQEAFAEQQRQERAEREAEERERKRRQRIANAEWAAAHPQRVNPGWTSPSGLNYPVQNPLFAPNPFMPGLNPMPMIPNPGGVPGNSGYDPNAYARMQAYDGQSRVIGEIMARQKTIMDVFCYAEVRMENTASHPAYISYELTYIWKANLPTDRAAYNREQEQRAAENYEILARGEWVRQIENVPGRRVLSSYCHADFNPGEVTDAREAEYGRIQAKLRTPGTLDRYDLGDMAWPEP